ncbi:MAG: hypothetical protein DDT35_01287 [Firmicutes bacterium]|nr:hypothetical protein [Bacillota bacterium]
MRNIELVTHCMTKVTYIKNEPILPAVGPASDLYNGGMLLMTG